MMEKQIKIDLRAAKEMQGFQKDEKDVRYYDGQIDALNKLLDHIKRVKKLTIPNVIVPKGTLPDTKESKCCGRCIQGMDVCIHDTEDQEGNAL